MVDSVNLGSLYATVELRSGNLQGGINQAVAQFDAAGKKINAAAVGLAAQLGRSMTLAGAGMAAGLGVAVKAAADFDQAMRNTNSLLKLNEQGFQELKKSVADLANDPKIRQGPNDLAKAMYDVASSGFQGKQALDILRQSAYGASAGMTDTATSSRVLMAVLNSGVSGIKNAREAMDVLFREVDLGVNTFEQLANTLGNVLPTAKVAGVSLQEVTAALAAMTRRGINVEESVTALNNLMVQLIKPHKEAKKVLDELGISYGLAGLQAKGLTGILQQMSEQTGANKQKLVEAMPEIRALKAMLTLTDESGRQYTDMLKGAKTATEGFGATQKALTEQNKGAQAQMEMLRKSLEQVAIQIGNNVLPGLRHLVGGLRDALEWFSKLPDPVKTDAIQIAAVGTAALFAGGALVTLAARVLELRAAMVAAGITGAGFVATMARAAAVLNPATLTATGMLLETNAGGDNGLSTMPKGANALKFWQDRLRGLQGAARANLPNQSIQDQIAFARKKVQELSAVTPATILPSMIRPDPGAAGVDKILSDLKKKSGGGPDTTAADERASASRTVADDIYALTHGDYDVRRRRAKEERDDAIASGVARVDAERRYQLELKKIHEEAAAAQRKTESDALGEELAQQQEMIAQAIDLHKESVRSRRDIDAEIFKLSHDQYANERLDATNTYKEMLERGVQWSDAMTILYKRLTKIRQEEQRIQTQRMTEALDEELRQTREMLDQIIQNRKDADAAMFRAEVDSDQALADELNQTTDEIAKTDERRKEHRKKMFEAQFGFLGDLAHNLAGEFTDEFGKGLERALGKSMFARAFARTLENALSGVLDKVLQNALTVPGTNQPKAPLGGHGGLGNLPGVIFNSFLDTGISALTGGIFSGIAGLFGGGKKSGGGLGGLLGGVVGGIGHIFGFADGGIAPPGRISLVGERGPELIMPASATRVVPLGGGGTTIHAPITVHAAPGMDTRQLAKEIGYEIYKLQRVRAGSG